jgi:hypothetical protein
MLHDAAPYAPSVSAGVSVSGKRGRHWARTSRLPQVELVAVGDTHEVVVPRGLNVQSPEPDF